MPARRLLVATLAALAVAAPVAAGAPAPEGSQTLVKAEALASIWGRCPTAAPANGLLQAARRPAAERVRDRRAGAALRAFRSVALECAKPVPLPRVSVPPSEGPVLPPAEPAAQP